MLKGKLMIKESYLVLVIIIGIVMMCLYSTFALFSLEKTTSKDIISLNTSNVDVSLSISEYKQLALAAGEIKTVYLNVTNDNANTIYYGVWYQMVSPSTITTDITIAKIDWSANPTSGTISASTTLPVELVIRNDSTSSITVNIGVAGSDTNELGLTAGKTLITDTFNTGTEITEIPSGDTISKVYNFDYTNSAQSQLLQKGKYKLEVWGAQGGYRSTSSKGGMGGYSYGMIELASDTTVYVYTGGFGGSGTSGCGSTICAGGFNGGGYRYKYYGGGGASDIRIGQDSLYARVIVAGGGGSDGAASKTGMYGGGTSGGSSTEKYTANSNYCGKGGTATYSGYSSSYTVTTQATTGLNSNTLEYYGGGFGFGGGGVYRSSGYGGAGGGGWYGGSGTVPDSSGDDDRGGGGGSGYVYTSSTTSNYPSGCLLDSSYYLTDAATSAGNTSFTSPDGATETGHSGNGYARISKYGPSIPTIDTSSVSITLGTDTNLKDIVTCEDAGNGCKILFVSPNNTKQLTAGSHNATYVLEDNSGTRYKYTKVINIS